MTYNFIRHYILEGKSNTLVHLKLPYGRDDLAPVKSKETVDYHYGTLYKGYVDRYNTGEGDADFNEAGAFLHNIYFGQLQSPSGTNPPKGAILEFVNKHHKGVDQFKEKFAKTAMGIQGSGWVYLATDGKIKTMGTFNEVRKAVPDFDRQAKLMGL